MKLYEGEEQQVDATEWGDQALYARFRILSQWSFGSAAGNPAFREASC